jgi:serine phosphatase RsbU (regulator of sigma subunit)/anti-sigma regulatory factor (Ser/Thr protein kinase)
MSHRSGEAAPVPPGGDGPSPGAAGETGRQLEQMLSITDAALGYLSLEEMLSELLGRIRDALGADTAAILLLDEDRGVLVARAARGLEEEVRQGVQVPLARGFAGRVAAGRKPIVIEDLSRADVVNPLLRQKGIRSMLGVPVHVEGRVIGVMHVGTLVRRLFNEEDTALLQLAADRAALAIDAARLTEQRSVTEIMQRALLPDALPSVPGLRFSAKYLPGGTGVKIGGDWYDVFNLPNGRFGFVVGDVVGRGVLAASVMAEIRTALRAYLVEGHPLPEVMRLLNELLVGMGRHRSATAAILELDFENGTFEVVSAGHLPPLLVSPDGEQSFLEPIQGLPLGIRRGGDYRARRYPFDAGSILLLYTDGLVERRGEPLDEGMDRLRAAARRAARETDASFADRLYRGLLDEGTILEDDVALLAVESLPLGPEIEMTLEAEPGVLAGLRSTLGRWLMSEGVGEDELFNITLAVSEAAANSIEHAYGAHEASFRVSGVLENGEVRVIVSDGGRWRAARAYGRGRGLAIMRSLVDDARIERGSDGTSVTLVKRVNVRPGQ